MLARPVKVFCVEVRTHGTRRYIVEAIGPGQAKQKAQAGQMLEFCERHEGCSWMNAQAWEVAE